MSPDTRNLMVITLRFITYLPTICTFQHTPTIPCICRQRHTIVGVNIRKVRQGFVPHCLSWLQNSPELLNANLVTWMQLGLIRNPSTLSHNQNVLYAYRMDLYGYHTDECWQIKHKVQNLIDADALTIDL